MFKVSFWKSTLFLSVLLLGSTFAGRLDEVARRKGYHPNAVRDLHNAKLRERAEQSKAKPRYLNDNTKKYFVESMPDVPKSFMTEMYSGLVPVYDDPSRALFFVFQPRIGEPVDEVTIWMNGGPGCSSLEGFLQENGYIRWTWGQYNPTINPYSWVNLTNVLWVEQPVGTGFSIGKANATNEDDISRDFISFFKNWQKEFGIKNYKIYVTGESYAGRYVPYISNAMLDQNDTEYYDVKGNLIYDPCIGAFDAQNDIQILPFIEQNNNVLNYNQSFIDYLTEKDEECGWKKYREDYMHYPPSGTQPPLAEPTGKCALWSDAYFAAYAMNPCFNVYMIGAFCPLLSDPLGYPTDLQYLYSGLEEVYFNRTDVKKAMHAPMDVSWLECAANPVFVGKGGGIYNDESPGSGGPEGYGDTSPDPLQDIRLRTINAGIGVLPRVIEATNRVLIAQGALDMDILTNATILAIQNMTWNGQMGFQSCPSKLIDISLPDLEYASTFNSSGFPPLDAHQGIMGKQHYERGLMFAETYLAGHMEPQFQPRVAYRHLQWVLGRIEEL